VEKEGNEGKGVEYGNQKNRKGMLGTGGERANGEG